MRVLHVITGLAPGGAEVQLRELLRHTRHEAEVVCLYNPGAVAGQLRADGVRVTDLGMRRNTEVGAVTRLTRLIRRGRYDVVHTHLYRACIYGRVAARLAGVGPILATEHSLLDDQLEGRPATRGVRALYLATERLGRGTIAVSGAVRDNLLRWGVPAERLTIVPNGLDLPALAFDDAARAAVRRELGIPPDATVVGAVGRLHPGKEFAELISALAPTLGSARQLVIVGEGPERGRLAGLARTAGVTPYVHLPGEQPVPPWLSAMDLLASPSRYETFGLAVLEALANGLPVVHRRCPALDELGTPVPKAFRAPPDDAGLRTLIDRVLGNDDAGADGGPRDDDATTEQPPRACPPVLAELAMPVVAAAIDAIYEELVRSGRLSSATAVPPAAGSPGCGAPTPRPGRG